MEYRVVPFHQSKNISGELQTIINKEATEGWEYVNHHYHHYLRPGSDGCFGFGKRPDQIWHIGNVVFQKKS